MGACNGQGIPLTSFPLSQSGESSRKTHDGYNKGESTGRGNFKLGRKRGSSSHQETSGALNQSPICGSQKQRRVATNYRPTTINVPKSVLTPSKQIDFLGFTINTSTMTISLPVVKKVEIQRETSQLLRCPSIQTRTLACLLGKLVATKPAVFIAPLHYCALQSLKISALHAQQETVALSPEATDNLKWWSTQLHRHCSSPILKPEASTVITSDASLKGWGAACQERTTGGLWSTEEACFHINLLELKAAYLALQCFLKETVSTHVLMRLDNRTAIAYLNRMGGPSFSPLCQLAIDIWNWCLARQITLHAEYLPGTENTRADWESRHHHDSSNWKLCPSVFEALNYLMGPLSIDLFASRINYQLPVYCSWKPDPGARTVDAFSISWARETPYLFPPFLPDWQSFVEDQQRGSRLCMPGSASMAISDLVSSVTGHINGPTNTTPNRRLLTPEPRSETTSPPAGRELVPDRLAYLRQHFEMQGLSPRAAELLIESWRGNTNDAYNTAWRKWLCWCTERDINPISTSVINIMQFLVDQFDTGLQYRTINTLRSAISTTHPDIEGSQCWGSYFVKVIYYILLVTLTKK